MIARSSMGTVLLAFAAALLLLFSAGDVAHAVTWKLGYTTTLSDYTAGANADIVSTLTIAKQHVNFTKLDTASAPPEWSIAPGSAISDGAAVGQVQATSTLAVVGACTTTVIVTIPLFDATIAETNEVEWTGSGVNLSEDPDNNGLPAGLEQYPKHLNQLFNGIKPRARYYGYTNAIGGAPPTQLNFVIFNPGEFVGATGWPGMSKPEQEIGDAYGSVNFVVLDNPTPGNAAPSTIQEFCTPLTTVTTLWGKTRGEGETIPVAGASGETTGQCTGAAVGVNNDPLDDSVADDGCIVVTDSCGTDGLGDGVDNDADGSTDEDCGLVRAANPPANSGIYGTGTHIFHGYGQSQRDFDADGISNNEDGCPVNPDRLNIGGTGVSSSRELVSSGTSSGGNECDDLTDDDGDGPTGVVGAACLVGDAWCNDGCPGGPRTMEDDNGTTGNANNAVGDVCETLVLCPAVNAADCDSDGYLNRQDNCPLVANGAAGNNQLDDDLDRCGDAVDDDPNDDPGAPVLINDGCPAACGVGESLPCAPESATQCAAANAVDDDGDTKVNDGCPMVGSISEVCVNGEGATTDFGACNDAIGNSCDNVAGLNENVADGAYAKDLAVSPVCVGELDTDLDGWCDTTEALLGSLGGPEVGAQCANAVDDDSDIKVNDGCLALGAAETVGAQCDNAINDDANTEINDGCPQVGATAETGAQCANATDDDAGDADGFINDGCPQLGTVAEAGAECTNNTNDDTNTEINDGCPIVVGSAEAASTPEHTALDYKVGGVPMDPVPSLCNDFQWYASTGDAIGNGPAVDNDGNGGSNAGEADGVDPDAIGDCANMTWDGADQDGVAASASAIKNAADNCAADWNPEQLNSDKGAGEAAATGDACDTDDDEDKISDVLEWKQGSDSKNVFSPRDFDMTGNDAVDVLDILTLTGATAYPAGTLPDYWYPSCCCKSQPFTYTFVNNTGAPADTVNGIKIWWATPLQISKITDSDTPANVWTKKIAVTNRASLKTTGTLEKGKTLTITALSCKKQQVVCYQWLSGATVKGGSWNSTDCATLQAP